MKFYHKYKIGIPAILVSLVLFLGSCKKYLNLSPTDEFASNTFWTSEQNALQALTGVYSVCKKSG